MRISVHYRTCCRFRSWTPRVAPLAWAHGEATSAEPPKTDPRYWCLVLQVKFHVLDAYGQKRYAPAGRAKDQLMGGNAHVMALFDRISGELMVLGFVAFVVWVSEFRSSSSGFEYAIYCSRHATRERCSRRSRILWLRIIRAPPTTTSSTTRCCFRANTAACK